ncbi:hypothetical protein ACGF7U_04315 [Micromonospora sp. NPDC047670]|uniref:hypothetical protein n=1 Tax=Micromonospora sp. NPDC047670 TaxID=3364252 RepID=UPI00372380F2
MTCCAIESVRGRELTVLGLDAVSGAPVHRPQADDGRVPAGERPAAAMGQPHDVGVLPALKLLTGWRWGASFQTCGSPDLRRRGYDFDTYHREPRTRGIHHRRRLGARSRRVGGPQEAVARRGYASVSRAHCSAATARASAETVSVSG